MFDFIQTPSKTLSAKDARAYALDDMRTERDELAGLMMLNAAGRARLAQLNQILSA